MILRDCVAPLREWYAECSSVIAECVSAMIQGLPVDVFAVSGFEHQHDKNVILKLAKDPVIAATVAPDVVQLAFELLAPLAGVPGAGNVFIQIIDDPGGGLFIELLELLQSPL